MENASPNWIYVTHAAEHNLKNVSLRVPKNALTVITGPSGSGKSSLALDVLYAEGQRRYMESLSAYARQFLGMPLKPDVERIDGLCPAIAIDQKTVGSNPRSTVGTITEVYDYLRVLFARIGHAHCPECGQRVQRSSPEEIATLVEEKHASRYVTITAPYAQQKKGEFRKELRSFVAQGWTRFLIDGTLYVCATPDDVADIKLRKTQRHTIEIVIDACDINPDDEDYDTSRLRESIETACTLAFGRCHIHYDETYEQFSTQAVCLCSGRSLPELEPRLFSFNSPIGACPECHGIGHTHAKPWMDPDDDILPLCTHHNATSTCPSCGGKRLCPEALAVLVNGATIYDVCSQSIRQTIAFFKNITLSEHEHAIAHRLLQEITTRLSFLENVGLGYLSLNRHARTLSGGEGQRIRLARQLGAALSGVLYVLDEPSIGLHQRDNDRLIATLKALRDQGNTVLVVEHDHDTMLSADYVVDMGPHAGAHGGNVVACGTPDEVQEHPTSITGAYLSGQYHISRAHKRRQPAGYLTVSGARQHNLADVTASIPRNVMCCVSGVSGSGKSTLVMEELVPRLYRDFMYRDDREIAGSEHIEALVVITQTPIGRTPRSNPATYLGVFDHIRALFASLPASNARGYGPGRFSFNVSGGRCKKCKGDGILTVSMHFLPDVHLTCNACQGTRYSREIREITYKGKNIAEVLEMSASEAYDFFANHTRIAKRLKLMCDVGLDYVRLGQSSTTLSGGEAQRIKLVNELAKRGRNTLYVLDEPTTGLHACDIQKLLDVLNRLVDKGNSVLIIEHNLDVLAHADYILDLGPEGGDEGGTVVAYGTPEEVAAFAESHTGRYLAPLVGKRSSREHNNT